MEDLGGFDSAAAARDQMATRRLVSGAFDHAVRAWHAAVEAGVDPGTADTVRASLRDFEKVAELAETPVRQRLFDAARRIRAGDLIGATAAFEVAIPPAAVTPRSAVGRFGLVLPAIGLPPPWLGVISSPQVLGAYLGLLAVAELAVTFVNPLLVFPLHGGIVVLTAFHVALLEQRPEREAHIHPLAPFLLAFLLVALIRIISLTLPLGSIEPAYQFVFAGVPMTVGALLVARASGFSPRGVGVVWRFGGLQAAIVVASVALGFVEFLILRPESMGSFPWTASFFPALAVGISTGFPEELIFRGLMQTATRPLLGRWNWVYVSAVFAILHIGYQSVLDLAFVFGVGLLYGWVFERTRSIVGVSIGHGLANVVLFFVAPNIPELVRALGS